MSLQHAHIRQINAAPKSGEPAPPDTDTAFWYSYIDEKEAGSFLGFEPRTMQALRQRGGGPRYHALSSRCIRYRRIDLKVHADAHARKSTSDGGANATA